MRNIYLFFLLILAQACNLDRTAEVQEEITRRVERERKVYSEACRNKIMLSAEALADSLLLTEAKLQVNDSLRNRLPYKPLPPAEVAPIDTAVVKPLFEQK
jgi:hypothetical protein